jgi:diguanylate cyclase (GGDEF)-like protein
MSMQNKILTRIGLMIIASTVAIILIVLVNFRTYGINAATDKAEIVSELVKNGLTSHMINGTMDKRESFLKNISHIKDVEKLWVLRSELVNKQYGPAKKHELPRDVIDEEVLLSGQKQIHLTEKSNKALLRVTIPYNASADELINCFQCHDANHGDTLGAISMEFDITSVREEGVATIIKILLTTVIAIVLVIFLTNRLLNPYLELFESLKTSIKRASAGNFTDRIESTLTDEAGDMVQAYDSLLGKLEKTFGQIDKKLRTFVASRTCNISDPLTDAEEIITSLTRLYQFKKAIELDRTKEDIYNRLAYVLENYFHIPNFTFAEITNQTNESQVILEFGELLLCNQGMDTNADLCRAKRTGIDVASDDFPELCSCYKDHTKNYLCIPINIGGNVGLVIHIITETPEELAHIKAQVGLIKSYANEAAPVIESKRLMQVLRDSSLKDSLTGLYNRRFLDEYVEKLKPQVMRQKISVGILMIDMDHFKMVNDTYGHNVGDVVLKELSSVLNSHVRDADLVIRYGGEEFIVLLMNVESEERTIEIAEKLREKVQMTEIAIGDNKRLNKTVSIGVSMFPGDSESIWQTIKYADVALYEAKKRGRNRMVRFDGTMWNEDPNF